MVKNLTTAILLAAWSIVLALLWWGALFDDWHVTLHFNHYQEAILEGILFHLSAGWGLWLLWKVITPVPTPSHHKSCDAIQIIEED